jgi:hypothetical protein
MADSIKVCMVGLLYLFSATVPPAAQSGNKCEMSFMRR